METTTKKSPEEIKRGLDNFYGTSQYYVHRMPFARFNYTDGVRYVAEECEAYWMLDIIGSYQHKLSGEGLQVFKFAKDGDSMDLVIEDGNSNELASQHISYTDFPLDEIELWFTNGVALLPTEY